MNVRRLIRSGLAAAGIVAAVGALLSSCIDTSGVTEIACAPLANFTSVSPVLEQRCGTLDCHGSEGRAMRIYGSIGLRAPDPAHANDPDYYPGGKTPTTPLEQGLNYRSVCGLEPELTNEVVENKAQPDVLTLVRKPRLTEKHKGGRIWDQGKPGDRCLVGWLESGYAPSNFSAGDCQAELMR